MELIPTIVYQTPPQNPVLAVDLLFPPKKASLSVGDRRTKTAPKVYIIPEVIWVEAIWNVDLTVLFRSHTIFQAMYNPTNSVRLGYYRRIKKWSSISGAVCPQVIRNMSFSDISILSPYLYVSFLSASSWRMTQTGFC